MVHSIEFIVSYTQNVWNFCIRKMDENIYSKLVGFSKFPTYFYMKTLINYYDYEFLKNTLIHISVLSI
jgi:hypothetical protein